MSHPTKKLCGIKMIKYNFFLGTHKRTIHQTSKSQAVFLRYLVIGWVGKVNLKVNFVLIYNVTFVLIVWN